jgi:hypothetical protein
MTNKDISIQIKNILDQNKINDLQRFLKKRQYLNNVNSYLIYLFYFVQSVGILTTSIGTSYKNSYIIWTGISLNIFASLINVYEKTNNSIIKKLMTDIKNIKDDNYVDESELIETDNNKNDNAL